eukprot:5431812-Pyramimonas_sp.AAC.1
MEGTTQTWMRFSDDTLGKSTSKGRFIRNRLCDGFVRVCVPYATVWKFNICQIILTSVCAFRVVYDTLLSIYSQECTRRVQTSIRRVGADENLEKLEQRFLNGESVAHICNDVKSPPCVLLRLLLVRILGVGKQ